MNLFEKQPEKGILSIEDGILIIRSKKGEKELALSEINSINFVYNKSILWLVIGGVIAPLAGVGFIKGIINPWLALIYIISGVLIFYYGWQGRSMLQINYGFHKKLIVSVDDNRNRWYNFITAFRELKDQY